MTAAQKLDLDLDAPAHLDEHAISESQLLDVLYEVLAQGVPPKGTLRRDDVEAFLHEHARNKKSATEMRAFFSRHGLPLEAAEYGADPELGELASGLHRERTLSDAFPIEPEPLRSGSESGPVRKMDATVEVDVDETAPRLRTVTVQSRSKLWAWGAAAAAFVTLAGALLVTHLRAQRLSVELDQARLAQHSADTTLSALEDRAESLQSALSTSELERRALSTKFEAFVSGEAQERQAEQAALSRLLGPRFEALRAQALTSAQPTR